MPASKQISAEKPKQNAAPSRRGTAVISILRSADYLRRSFALLIGPYGVTRQQYNVLRILRGAGPQGLPTLDIAERMIEEAPGITRLLDRLEAKKLVRRERPTGDRRQVVCYVTDAALEMLKKLDEPVRERGQKALHTLNGDEVEELIGLLERVLANTARR